MKQVLDLNFVEFISQEKLEERINEIADQINERFEDKNPIFLGILNGSFMFMAELFKKVNIKSEVSFLKVASYQNETSTGKVKELIGLNDELTGRHVIIVEDIVDTGHTLKFLINKINQEIPASLTTITLLHKPTATIVENKLDYIGFEIENKFVLGFGLDYNGFGRNSPSLYIKAN